MLDFDGEINIDLSSVNGKADHIQPQIQLNRFRTSALPKGTLFAPTLLFRKYHRADQGNTAHPDLSHMPVIATTGAPLVVVNVDMSTGYKQKRGFAPRDFVGAFLNQVRGSEDAISFSAGPVPEGLIVSPQNIEFVQGLKEAIAANTSRDAHSPV